MNETIILIFWCIAGISWLGLGLFGSFRKWEICILARIAMILMALDILLNQLINK